MDFSALIDCGTCGETYEGRWHDDSIDIEQMDEAPSAAQTCPHCGATAVEKYPGWTYMSEAG